MWGRGIIRWLVLEIRWYMMKELFRSYFHISFSLLSITILFPQSNVLTQGNFTSPPPRSELKYLDISCFVLKKKNQVHLLMLDFILIEYVLHRVLINTWSLSVVFKVCTSLLWAFFVLFSIFFIKGDFVMKQSTIAESQFSACLVLK